jgi:hypothetical protein
MIIQFESANGHMILTLKELTRLMVVVQEEQKL